MSDQIYLTGASQCFSDFITTLPDETLALTKPIPIEVKETSDGFYASFNHRGFGAYGSGDSYEEAVDFLRYFLANSYESFENIEEPLGPAMVGQRNALSEYICRVSKE